MNDFSKIAIPLTQLIGKCTKLGWNEKWKKSFQELKKRLVRTPILVLPDGVVGYAIYCDASNNGLRGLLM